MLAADLAVPAERPGQAAGFPAFADARGMIEPDLEYDVLACRGRFGGSDSRAWGGCGYWEGTGMVCQSSKRPADRRLRQRARPCTAAGRKRTRRRGHGHARHHRPRPRRRHARSARAHARTITALIKQAPARTKARLRLAGCPRPTMASSCVELELAIAMNTVLPPCPRPSRFPQSGPTHASSC